MLQRSILSESLKGIPPKPFSGSSLRCGDLFLGHQEQLLQTWKQVYKPGWRTMLNSMDAGFAPLQARPIGSKDS